MDIAPPLHDEFPGLSGEMGGCSVLLGEDELIIRLGWAMDQRQVKDDLKRRIEDIIDAAGQPTDVELSIDFLGRAPRRPALEQLVAHRSDPSPTTWPKLSRKLSTVAQQGLARPVPPKALARYGDALSSLRPAAFVSGVASLVTDDADLARGWRRVPGLASQLMIAATSLKLGQGAIAQVELDPELANGLPTLAERA